MNDVHRLSAVASRGARTYRRLRGTLTAARAARAPEQVITLQPATYQALLHRLAADCRSVLDVGTGLMHSLRDSPCRTRIGLDAHRPYLERRVSREAVPLHADALRLRELFVSGAVDLVTMLDVIEHFDRNDALDLLAQAEDRVAIFRGLHSRANISFVKAFGPDAPPVDGLVAWKSLGR